VTTAEAARDLDLLRRAVGDPKLHYQGLSYGTYLGATYANLFPGKVGALVLDANFAPVAYTNGGKQKALLSRAQRLGLDLGGATTLAAMLRLCGRATVADCAFSAGTAAKTRAKFEALLARLRKGPVVIGTGPAAINITYPQLLRGVFYGLYVVHPGWSDLAKDLQELWLARGQRVQFTPATPASPTRYAGPEQTISIICAETPSPGPLQFPHLARQELRHNGPIGLVPLWGDEPCSTWPVHSAASYFGPWNTRTAAPILVIGNTTDPATPLKNSVEMAAELARARLLVVRGYGHGAFGTSRCADNAEVGYFVHGVLPSPGTACAQDSRPFQGK